MFYQAKSYMFFNVWTTYWTFIHKNWTREWDIIALRNTKYQHTQIEMISVYFSLEITSKTRALNHSCNETRLCLFQNK